MARAARLGREEELGALQRLDTQARALERVARGPRFEELVAREEIRSPAYGGMTVAGPAKPPAPPAMTG